MICSLGIREQGALILTLELVPAGSFFCARMSDCMRLACSYAMTSSGQRLTMKYEVNN